MSADDDRHTRETVDRAVRLRDATFKHFDDPNVMRASHEVIEMFALRAEAADLTPLQTLAAAARTAFALGAGAHELLRARAPDGSEWADLDAFRAAFAVLVDMGIQRIHSAAAAAKDPGPDTDTDQETRH